MAKSQQINNMAQDVKDIRASLDSLSKKMEQDKPTVKTTKKSAIREVISYALWLQTK